MHKKPTTASLAVFAAAALAGCGGGSDAPTVGSETPAPAAAAAVDPASITDPGTISGSINFGGDAETQVIQMAADPLCLAAHVGEEVLTQRLVVNDNGTLRYVFVYVKEGLDQTFTTPSETVELSQEGCMYVPHMVGVQTNQTLSIINNDDFLHNVNAQPSAGGNEPFNYGQMFQGQSNEVVFPTAEMIPVKCDVHPWMQAYIGVTNHPYFAISSEDGSFTIGNLPAGDYVVAAWHETLGEQTQNVAVGANATAEVSFEFGS